MTDPSPAARAARRQARLWPLGWALAGCVAVAVLLVSALIAAGFWLFGAPGVRRPDQFEPNQLFDLLKLAFAVTGGVGAVVALVVAYRRQRVAEAAHALAEAAQDHHERVAAENRHDAEERRITDLYTKAVEQLGSEKAAVRLGGMYALERVAQGNAGQRQTVVNVLCAYLRMPLAPAAPDAGAPAGNGGHAEEQQVRLTAQRILADHLTVAGHPGDRFWPGLVLDLTGAHLVDLDLRRARFATATLVGAEFHGETAFSDVVADGPVQLDRAVFHGPASFERAMFRGAAAFRSACFAGDATFTGAHFRDVALFGGATFHGGAAFDEATFDRGAGFGEATFHVLATFSRATFWGDVGFLQASFRRTSWFSRTSFHGDAWLDDASFADSATFARAHFHGVARFAQAVFGSVALFDDATFDAGAGFRGAGFRGDVGFERTTFGLAGEPDLTGARLAGRAELPDGWVAGPDPDGTGATLVRATAG